jgi:protein phosphatase
LKISFASYSHTGQVREHNEDRYCIGICKDGQVEWDMQNADEVDLKEGAIFAVADGMGGEKYGEVAAELAIETVKSFFSSHPTLTNPYKDLQKCFQQIYASIKSSIKQNPDQIKMGTTLTVLYLDTEAMAHVLWLGDTRLYLFSENEIPPINSYDLSHLQIKTRDHSPVWEMVEEGHLTPEEARLHENNNIINKSIGGYFKKEKPEYNFFKIKENTSLLICSDGLNNMLPDEHIQNVLLNNEYVESSSNQLLADALNYGGHDNITSILIKMLELSEEEKSASPPIQPSDPEVQKGSFLGKVSLAILIFTLLLSIVFYVWPSHPDVEENCEETKLESAPNDEKVEDGDNKDKSNYQDNISSGEIKKNSEPGVKNKNGAEENNNGDQQKGETELQISDTITKEEISETEMEPPSPIDTLMEDSSIITSLDVTNSDDSTKAVGKETELREDSEKEKKIMFNNGSIR